MLPRQSQPQPSQLQSTNAGGGTFIAQVFLNFSKSATAMQESLTRRSTMSGSMKSQQSFSAGDASLSLLPAIPTPEHPFLLRLQDSCVTEEATVEALRQHYMLKWSERAHEILDRLAEDHNLKPSESLAAELTSLGKRSHGGSAAPKFNDNAKRLSSVEIKKERTADETIRAVLRHEERNYYEEVLPSRFLEDFVICVALADGSLPDPKGDGAVTTASPWHQQQQEAAENARNWIVPPATVVKQHPKASLPYTFTIFYKPTKATRTMNDIMSRSASFVATSSATEYAGTADANVAGLVGAVSTTSPSRGGSPLRAAVQQLVQQSAPKNMLDDEAAKKRGFTILPFLPQLKSGETADPAVVRLLTKAVGQAAQPQGGPQQRQQTVNSQSLLDPSTLDDERTEIDVTVDELLLQAGLTLYDVARHGNGPLASMGKEHVAEQAPTFVKSDVERRRQENVIKAERQAALKEDLAVKSASTRELTLREQHALIAKAEAEAAKKTALDIARMKSEQELSKESRRLALEKQVAEYKKAAALELEAAKSRQEEYLKKMEAHLREKAYRRMLDTTLEGERMKAEALSRLAGPLSLKLNDFRPKVKQLDQRQRQDNILRKLVSSLESESAESKSTFDNQLGDEMQQRVAYQTLVQNQHVVRGADSSALEEKRVLLRERVEYRQLQQSLLNRSASEISVLKIAKRTPTSYFTPVEAESVVSQEKERSFLEWKEQRKKNEEAKIARRELGYHA